MTLLQRYKRLSLWNKLSVWGALASIFGILLVVIMYIFQNDKIVDEDTQPRNINSTNTLIKNIKDRIINRIDRFHPSYLEVIGDKPKIKDINKVEPLKMSMAELMKQGKIIMDNGNFSVIEDYKFHMDGKWIEWEGIVSYANSVRGMGWDYNVSVKSKTDRYITSSLLFYGKGWDRKVLSLRRGDVIKFSGRIHQIIPGLSISVNIYDFELVIEP